MYENGLIRKPKPISKFQNYWEKTITMHILPNISKSKDNQPMKFDQLVEYKYFS